MCHDRPDLLTLILCRWPSFYADTCVGTQTCKYNRPGSYGNFELDAQTFAEWGVDQVCASIVADSHAAHHYMWSTRTWPHPTGPIAGFS